MLGAIIGDIVGSRWEFDPTNDYNFEWLSDENGFTDDTICTVAVADALLKGRDFGESIHEWCRRYPHPMGGVNGFFLSIGRRRCSVPHSSSAWTRRPPALATALGMPAAVSAEAISIVPRSTPPCSSSGRTCRIFMQQTLSVVHSYCGDIIP